MDGDCFEIGQRVVSFGNNNQVFGKLGTVVETKKTDGIVYSLIEFDENVCGHDGQGLGKDGYCWWLEENELEFVGKKQNIKEKLLKRCKAIYY